MTVPGLAAISRGIDRMVEFYHRTLLVVLQHRTATMLVTFATIALNPGPVCDRPEGISCRCRIPPRSRR